MRGDDVLSMYAAIVLLAVLMALALEAGRLLGCAG